MGKITRVNTDILYLNRLEIDEIDILVPNNYGQCLNDYMVVNQDVKFSRICGLTQDNHCGY